MLTYHFAVLVPGEPLAGLPGVQDTVTVSVASECPGGEPGEFEQFLAYMLAQWYGGKPGDVTVAGVDDGR